MKFTRREFMKAQAAASAAAVAGIALPVSASNIIASKDATKIKWEKPHVAFVELAVVS